MRLIAVLMLLVAGLAHAQTPPTVTFNATVTSAVAPITTVLTWSSTGAVSCVATGTTGWNGSVPTSGTRTLTSIGVDMRLTLTCTGPSGPDAVTISWVAPTTNTDGTSLTDLAGFTVYRGTTTTLSPLPDVIPGTAGSVTLASQPAGTLFYAVTAHSNRGSPVRKVESALSNVASKVVGAPGATASAAIDIDVIPAPSPPTNVLASDAQAYTVKPNSTGALVATRIGLVAPGTACLTETVRVGTITYTRVPREKVDVVNFSSGKTYIPDVFAKCG
jgi:hypothetical protein